MTTKGDFQRLAELRFSEAELLLNQSSFPGAYYIAGYAVECALKAIICLRFSAHTLPDKNFVQKVHSHKLDELMTIAGVKVDFEARAKADDVFKANWGIISQWSEQSRYEFKDEFNARALLDAIGNKNHGLLPWLKTLW
jgi:HEPN domain-containing protein